MIAKTVTGSDFVGALEYGAGLRSARTNKQAQLVSVANIGSRDAAGIAAEMQAVAALSPRIQRPVWHTVLSWAPGEQVSREQKLQAAALYCELMGASLQRHQVAVYEHRDKQHPHLHIYINRVPTDGGAALRCDHNYARNVRATRQIRARLGMAALPARRLSTRDLDPRQEAARGYVREQLTAALQEASLRSLEQLVAQLRQQQIEVQLKRDAQGTLRGVSFRYQQTSVTGTDVGVPARQVRDHFGPCGRGSLRTTALPAPGVGDDRAAGRSPASAHEDPPGGQLRVRDGSAARPSSDPDDAGHNGNQGRRRRSRRRPRR